MSLTSEQKRLCYLYLGVSQVTAQGALLGGVPELIPTTHAIETALNNLTAAGETTVAGLLVQMADPYAAIAGINDSHGVLQAGSVQLRPDELRSRIRHWCWFKRQLRATLGIEEPFGWGWEP